MKLSRLILVILVSCFVLPALSNADPLKEAQTALDNKDFEKAYELLAPLSEAENVEAQTKLGVMYINGQGVDMDPTKGLGLITVAANKGYDVAQAIAINAYVDIANKGNMGAMYNVGGMCLKGWGGEQDKSVCLKWLEGAARLGHIRSGEMLNQIYKKGKFGISPDKEKAKEWKAVAKGFKKGLSGTWAGSVPGMGDGPAWPVSFTFRVKDDKFKGTTMGANFRPIQLEDCKIDGNKFSYKYSSKWEDSDMIFYYTGTFYGDVLEMSYTVDSGFGIGPPTKIIARRSQF